MTSSFRELLVSSSSTSTVAQNHHAILHKYSNNFSAQPQPRTQHQHHQKFQQFRQNSRQLKSTASLYSEKIKPVHGIGIPIAEDPRVSYERARNRWRSIHIGRLQNYVNVDPISRDENENEHESTSSFSRSTRQRQSHRQNHQVEEIQDVIFGGGDNRRRSTINDNNPNSSAESGEGRDGKKVPFMKQTCFLLKVLCALNLLPCRWKSDTCQMEKRSPLIYKFWFVTVAMASWTNFLFVLFRFIQEVFIHWKKLQKNDMSVIIGLWGGLAFKCFVAVVTHNFSLQPDTYIAFTNQLLRLRMNPNRPEFRKDVVAAKVMGFFLYVRTAQLIVAGLTKANRPQFLYSLLPHRFRNSFTYLLYTLVQIYSSLNAITLLYFASISIIMVETTTSLLKTRFPPSVSQRSKLVMYKQLQILLVLYNNATQLGLYFLKFYTLLIGTISCYGSIRFYDDLDLRIYITMPLSFISLMSYAYEFYGKAGKIPLISQEAVHRMFTLRNEKNRQIIKENRGYMQSCRKMNVAKIGRHVFPNIMRFVFIQTIRLMIVMSRKKG